MHLDTLWLEKLWHGLLPLKIHPCVFKGHRTKGIEHLANVTSKLCVYAQVYVINLKINWWWLGVQPFYRHHTKIVTFGGSGGICSREWWQLNSSVASSILTGGAKWKNLPNFCLFFQIFPLFSRFFLIFALFFQIFGKFFAVRGGTGTLPPLSPLVATPLDGKSRELSKTYRKCLCPGACVKHLVHVSRNRI